MKRILTIVFTLCSIFIYESLLFATEHVLQGLNNNESRYLLLGSDQITVTLDNLGYSKQNILNNSYINLQQKQILTNQIDSLMVFVTNM
jgi:hypothetical protein